ncbi:MAG: SDR family oxidoreductase [Halioglobus sp.]
MANLSKLLILFAVALLAACSGGPDNSEHGNPAPTLIDTPSRPQHILVIGGTSGIGLQTAELAAQRGHHVTALARRPERMPLRHPRLQTVGGNILNKENMANAVRDKDAVVIAIGMGPTRDEVTLFSEGTANVLSAMQDGGVDRLIAITGIGAGDSRGHGGFFYENLLFPLALKTIYTDKDRMETLIQSSTERGIVWTIVRPGFLTDEPANHRYRVINDLQDVTAGDITRADVAHFIIAAIESGDYIGVSPLISE